MTSVHLPFWEGKLNWTFEFEWMLWLHARMALQVALVPSYCTFARVSWFIVVFIRCSSRLSHVVLLEVSHVRTETLEKNTFQEDKDIQRSHYFWLDCTGVWAGVSSRLCCSALMPQQNLISSTMVQQISLTSVAYIPFLGASICLPFFEPLVLVERKNISNIHGLFCHTRTPRSPKMSVKAPGASKGANNYKVFLISDGSEILRNTLEDWKLEWEIHSISAKENRFLLNQSIIWSY